MYLTLFIIIHVKIQMNFTIFHLSDIYCIGTTVVAAATLTRRPSLFAAARSCIDVSTALTLAANPSPTRRTNGLAVTDSYTPRKTDANTLLR